MLLRIVSRVHARTGKATVWAFFWQIYFITSFRRGRMMQNYLAAWRQRFSDYSFVLFVDHDSYLRIPFGIPDSIDVRTPISAENHGFDSAITSGSDSVDDHDLVVHINMFYALIKIEGSVSQILLPKVRSRVDIIEVSGAR
jgi:hypothetical protein